MADQIGRHTQSLLMGRKREEYGSFAAQGVCGRTGIQPDHDEGEQQKCHKASSASTDKPLARCFLPMEHRVKKEGEEHEPEP